MRRSDDYNVMDPGGLSSIIRTGLLVLLFRVAALLYRQSYSRTQMRERAAMENTHLRWLMRGRMFSNSGWEARRCCLI